MKNALLYRKRPVVIAAIQWDTANIAEIRKFFPLVRRSIDYLYIKTLEGEMRVDPNDWIIKGTAGEFYPCKPDIFEVLYESVSQVDQD